MPFQAFRDRVHPDDLPALEKALAVAVSNKSPFSQEYRVVHEDGTTLHVVAVGQFDIGPTGDLELEGIITDITERKAAEQALMDARTELARAVRLASIGELAGSVVHEVNQPLTGIVTSAEACARWLARDPVEPIEARKSAMRIIEEGHRASKVVTGLRSLVRDTQLHFAEVEINENIEEILLISKRELERVGVTPKIDLDRSLPNVEADRVQLQQVVLNLVRNAIESMADVNGRARVLAVSSKLADGCVSVAISDTGVGIDPSSRERLFDALHTTKAQGLGLGLSICRKIINAHRGRIWMENNVPHGTSIQLRSSSSATQPVVGEHLRMSSSAFVHIVDDDKAVRESLADLLRSLDYQVALYASAAEFLNVELPDTAACLVLDVRLPGTSGLELQEYLTRLNIRMPVILMTGFGDIPMTVKAMKAGAIDFLTKPVRDQDLLDAISAAIRLDQERRQEAAQIAQLQERYAQLTPRERQVMALVASGLMNKQVASELSISEVTVKMHRSSAMRKLGAKSVAGLVRIADVLDLPR